MVSSGTADLADLAVYDGARLTVAADATVNGDVGTFFDSGLLEVAPTATLIQGSPDVSLFGRVPGCRPGRGGTSSLRTWRPPLPDGRGDDVRPVEGVVAVPGHGDQHVGGDLDDVVWWQVR